MLSTAYAYKIQLSQQLKPNDHVQRRNFVDCIIEHQEMDADIFLQKLDNIDVDNKGIQRDSATCYAARETLWYLHETCPGRVLSRFDDQKFFPRSSEETPLYFFLWDYL